MAYVTHNYDVAVGSQGERGGLVRVFTRIGKAFARARQRAAEREYLQGNLHAVARDTGIDPATLSREANKSFWRK